MIKFNTPVNLNGSELKTQLNEVGISINDLPFIDGDGNLWLDIAQENKEKAKAVVSAHNGTIIALEPTVEQKLASVGLNLDDLKVALGL